MRADDFNRSKNYQLSTSLLRVGLTLKVYKLLLKIKFPCGENDFTSGTEK